MHVALRQEGLIVVTSNARKYMQDPDCDPLWNNGCFDQADNITNWTGKKSLTGETGAVGHDKETGCRDKFTCKKIPDTLLRVPATVVSICHHYYVLFIQGRFHSSVTLSILQHCFVSITLDLLLFVESTEFARLKSRRSQCSNGLRPKLLYVN